MLFTNCEAKLRNILHITSFTFLEIVRGKVLVGVFLASLSIGILSILAAEVSYGEKVNIALDIGLGLTSIFINGLAIFFGVGLISNEIESRTLQVLLSRPISRDAFLAGKIIGLTNIILLSSFLMSSITFSFYTILGGAINNQALYCLIGICAEALVVFSLALALSLVANKFLSTLLTIISILLGHSLDDILKLSYIAPAVVKITQAAKYLVPNLYMVNFKNYLLYEQAVDSHLVIRGLVYCIAYAMAVLLLSFIIFRRADLD